MMLNYLSETILLLIFLSIIKNNKKHNLLVPFLLLIGLCFILPLNNMVKLFLIFLLDTLYIYDYGRYPFFISSIFSLLYTILNQFLTSIILLVLMILFPYQYTSIYYIPLATLCLAGFKFGLTYILLEKTIYRLKYIDFIEYGKLSKKWNLIIYVIFFFILLSYTLEYQNNTYLFTLTTLMFLLLAFSLYHYSHFEYLTNQYRFQQARSSYLESLMTMTMNQSKQLHDGYHLLLKLQDNSLEIQDYIKKYPLHQRFVSIDSKFDQVINLILNQKDIQLRVDINQFSFIDSIDLYILLIEVIKIMKEDSLLHIQIDHTFKLSTKINVETIDLKLQQIISKYRGLVSIQDSQLVIVLFNLPNRHLNKPIR